MPIARRSLLLATSLGAATTLLAACGGSDDDPKITGVVAGRADLSLLAEAVQAADLGATLDGSGPFTLFAPTNTAFAALLTELGVSREQLLADRTLLRAVLLGHVLAADLPANDLLARKGQPLTTVGGGYFKVENDGRPTITDGRNRVANIVETNLHADNGVVHVIDRVLLPANLTVVQTAQSQATFSILVSAITAAGLVDALSAAGPFTVFAPTNDAFAALLTELGTTQDALLADTALLSAVLRYHVVPALVLKAQVPIGAPVTTLQGGSFTVGSDLVITDARGRRAGISATDVLASNGVVHVVDRVLLPPAA